MIDDGKLIRELKENSHLAFRELYDGYWSNVYHFAALYLDDPEEIREVVQEVFLKVWEQRHKIDDSGHFDGFLFIITRNFIFNNSRKSFNTRFYSLTVINALSDNTVMEEDIEARNMHEKIEEVISAMPPQRRKVFEMSRKQYKSYKEIALKLRISEKTVERHINEALKFIKSHLREELFMFFAILHVFF